MRLHVVALESIWYRLSILWLAEGLVVVTQPVLQEFPVVWYLSSHTKTNAVTLKFFPAVPAACSPSFYARERSRPSTKLLIATKIHVTFAQAWLAQVGEHRSAKRKSAGWIPEQRLVIEPASPCFGIFDIQLKTVFIISVDVLWLFLMFDVCKVLIFYSHYVTSCGQNVTL